MSNRILTHRFLPTYQTMPLGPGLGDYLRGSIWLAHEAHRVGNIEVELDFSAHPIGRYFQGQIPAGAEPLACSEYFDDRAALADEIFSATRGEGREGVCTNRYPNVGALDSEVLRGLRGYLSPTAAVEERVQQLAGNKHELRYAVFHVRVTDGNDESRASSLDQLSELLLDYVVPMYGQRVFILSNSLFLKQKLSERAGIDVLPTAPIHLGNAVQQDAAVLDTMVDFTLISRAHAVFSYSDYGWKSGFSYWCAVLHDVPFMTLRDLVIKGSPRQAVASAARSIYRELQLRWRFK